uniref:Uncharacterized protein n=1 Tax=mine drainage metagenome TaxID=410659 RepID=E6PUT5_9ZZZZ
MDVLGLKARLFGDILYTQVPVGIKYKKNNDFNSNFSGLGSPGTMKDVFVAYFPNKSLSLTAAYAWRGRVRTPYAYHTSPRTHAASNLTQELSHRPPEPTLHPTSHRSYPHETAVLHPGACPDGLQPHAV